MMKNTYAMRMMIVCVFACVSFAFLACSEKGQTGEVMLLPEYDSIVINIDYPILSDYVALQAYSRDGEGYVIGYNHFNHSLDFISLSGREHLSVELQAEGPDGVLKGIEFCQLQDKVFCLDSSGLLMLDEDGKVVARMPMKDLLAPEGKYRIRPRGLTFGNFSSINSRGSQAFVPLFPSGKDGSMKIGKVYDGTDHSINELPMEYPDEMREHIKLLGGLARPQITAYGDWILYNFPSSSSVYLYNRKSNQTETFRMDSRSVDNSFDLEKRKGNNLKGLFMNEMLTHRFKEVHYSAEAKVYYRVHYGARESMEDKERSIYLMVCDEDADNVGIVSK